MIFILLTFFQNAFAGHLVGGEINYECLGGNAFRFTVSTYMDPLGLTPGNSADSIMIGVYSTEEADGVDTFFYVKRTSIDTIRTVYNSKCTPDTYTDSVYKWNFVFDRTFVVNDSGYTVAYWRCCRPNSNLNVVSSQGLALAIDIESDLLKNNECNSSPVFDEFPPKFICSSDYFVINSAATDSDGDSLVYSLCAPRTGGDDAIVSKDWDVFNQYMPPFDSLLYNTGFSSTNPFGNGDITINSRTGVVSGTALTLGDFVVGICVEEYRDGELLTKSFRDVPIEVIDCEGLLSVKMDVDTSDLGYVCGLDVAFENKSVGGVYYSWDFGVDGIDTDTSSVENPIYSYADTGSYSVTLISFNDELNDCYDTLVQTIQVKYGFEFDYELQHQCDSAFIVFNNLSTVDSSALPMTWNWEIVGLDVLGDFSPRFEFTNSGNYTLELSAEDQNLCSFDSTWEVSFANRPEPDFLIDSNVNASCDTSVSFTNLSVGLIEDYYWDFGDQSMSTDTSNEFEPDYTYGNASDYTVTLIANGTNCSDTLTRMVSIGVPPRLNPVLDNNCYSDTVVFMDSSTGPYPIVSRAWTVDNQYNSADANFELGFSVDGRYSVDLSIQDSLGCTADTSFTFYFFGDLDVDWQVLNEGDSLKVCGTTVMFNNPGKLGNTSRIFWDFDGVQTQNTDDTVLHTYGSAGVYNVRYFVTKWENYSPLSGLSCPYNMNKQITVSESLDLDFSFAPDCDTMQWIGQHAHKDGLARITDWSINGDTESDSSFFVYENDNVEDLSVELTIVDSNGCTTDTAFVQSYRPIPETGLAFDYENAPDSLAKTGQVVNFVDESLYGDTICWIINNDSILETLEDTAHHIFSIAGEYPITQVVKNGTCDRSIDTVLVVDHKLVVKVPEIFSPNGDDLNDVVTIMAVGLETFNLKVFNRWGDMVYEAEDAAQVSWDGTNMKGNQLPAGIYKYIVSGKEIGNDMMEEMGEILLVR